MLATVMAAAASAAAAAVTAAARLSVVQRACLELASASRMRPFRPCRYDIVLNIFIHHNW